MGIWVVIAVAIVVFAMFFVMTTPGLPSCYARAEGKGYSYGPDDIHRFSPERTAMKSDYYGRTPETPVVPKKTCHACGQKLPIQVGNVVEGKHTGTRLTFQGVVGVISTNWADIITFDGRRLTHPTHLLTRLHGYYRVTERESML